MSLAATYTFILTCHILTMPVSQSRGLGHLSLSLLLLLSLTVGRPSPVDSTSTAPGLVPSPPSSPVCLLWSPSRPSLEQLLGFKIQIALSRHYLLSKPKHAWKAGVSPTGSLLHIFLKWLSPARHVQDPTPL